MRFLTLVRSAEASGPPPPALIEAFAKAGEASAQAGTLLDTGGLAPTATGTRVRLTGGKLSITDGPFAEGKEVVGSYAVLELPTNEKAVESGVWLMNMFKEYWPGWEGEVEIRRIFGPEDYGTEA